MEKQRKTKHRKQAVSTTSVASNSYEEVSGLEWEMMAMSREEEDLIYRMYKLVGERWDLIAGRIPGRTPEEIETFWMMKNYRSSQLR